MLATITLLACLFIVGTEGFTHIIIILRRCYYYYFRHALYTLFAITEEPVVVTLSLVIYYSWQRHYVMLIITLFSLAGMSTAIQPLLPSFIVNTPKRVRRRYYAFTKH